jgi:hypothetical protein
MRFQPAIFKFYEEYASPLFDTLGLGSLTLSDFHHAFSLVSSRAFHVDAYHKVAMVPIADAYVPIPRVYSSGFEVLDLCVASIISRSTVFIWRSVNLITSHPSIFISFFRH